MARPTLATHPKFAKLAHRLQSRALARGVLELVWESCYASGQAAIGDAEAVEAVADWRGPVGELAAALLQCGFLESMQMDASDGHLQYSVHDLEDHAPDYVLKRWERERKRQETGETIRSVRQRAARAKWMQADATGRRLQANVLPPAPAPNTDPDPDLERSARANPPPSGNGPAQGGGLTAVPPGSRIGNAVPLTRPAAAEPDVWSAMGWANRWKAAWEAHYAGETATQPGKKELSRLADQLLAAAETARLAAQERAGAILEEFLAAHDEVAVDTRHSFAIFAERWKNLRIAARRGKTPSRPAAARCDPHQRAPDAPAPTRKAGCDRCRHFAAAAGDRAAAVPAVAAVALPRDPRSDLFEQLIREKWTRDAATAEVERAFPDEPARAGGRPG